MESVDAWKHSDSVNCAEKMKSTSMCSARWTIAVNSSKVAFVSLPVCKVSASITIQSQSNLSYAICLVTALLELSKHLTVWVVLHRGDMLVIIPTYVYCEVMHEG